MSSEVLWTFQDSVWLSWQGHSCPEKAEGVGRSTGLSLRHRSVPAVLWLGVWPARQQSLFLSSSCPQRGRGSPDSQSTLNQVDQGLQVGRGLLRILGGGGDSTLSLS